MSTLFMDGCDWAADEASLKARYTDINTALARSPTGGRYSNSTGGVTLSGSAASAQAQLLPAWAGVTHTKYQGWLRLTQHGTPLSSAFTFLEWVNGGTGTVFLKYNPATDTLQLFESTTQLGTDDHPSLNDGNWHYVEWKIVASTTSGASSTIQIDGVERTNLTVSAVSFFQAAVTGLIHFAMHSSASVYTDVTWDDEIISDWSTGPITDFTGNLRINTLRPISDSSVTWAPSTGGSNFALVDETQYDASDSVSSSTINAQDLYGHTTFSGFATGGAQNYNLTRLPDSYAPLTVYSVQITGIGMNSFGSGTANASMSLKSGGTTSTGAGTTLASLAPPTQVRYVLDTDPATSASWLSAAVDAATFGPKALTFSSGGVARIDQCFMEVLVSEAIAPVPPRHEPDFMMMF